MSARHGAALVAIAALISGPIAMALVGAVHPQPAWDGAARFAHELHPIQLFPYLTGLGLVAGFVVLVAGLHARAPSARTAAALVFVGIYGAMVTLNYVLQTTFVPALASRYTPADDSMISALTMSNPRSLAWALEMWGYGMSGVATWLCASAIGGRAGAALIVNGVVSIAGALWTVAQPGWVMTPVGLVMFAAWNGVIVIAAVLVWIAPSGRARIGGDAPTRVDHPAAVGVR
ncbi:MAG TPA: hypothetical protein VL463_25200 [Kofleriaceae bacterium]|nr:hypothetical protein [Kofleriaceae bacterium]